MTFARAVMCAAMLWAMAHPAAVRACSCIAPAPPAASLEAADAVFAGRVLSVDAGPDLPVTSSADPVLVRIAATRSWKGDATAMTTVVTARSSASCGFGFAEGAEYLVYARHDDDGILQVSLCSRTAPLAAAQDDLVALGPGREIAPGSAPATDGTTLAALVAALLAVGAVAAALVVRVRASRRR